MKTSNKRILVTTNSNITRILSNIIFMLSMGVGFHLNYTLWQSWPVDIIIFVFCMIMVGNLLSDNLKMTEKEAIIYFKKLGEKNE
ncbi:MAG: hypothetical protein COA63_014245 [Methylophaga sp.]|nr:hypothetical protein [Methylophaga sp.]